MNEWLTSEEAARKLGITAGTLANWRTEGRGPKFMKKGWFILYHIDDIEAYLRARRRSLKAPPKKKMDSDT